MPILSTDVGDIRSLVEEYNVGMVVSDLHSEEALYEAFRTFLDKLPEFREYARRAAPVVRERFSGAVVAKDYSRCFRTAIELRSNRASVTA